MAQNHERIAELEQKVARMHMRVWISVYVHVHVRMHMPLTKPWAPRSVWLGSLYREDVSGDG